MGRNLLLLVLLWGYQPAVWAHEGHGIPGALPPAPHGGIVQEAKHDEKHDEKEREKKEAAHEHKEGEPAHADEEHKEQELFFEAVYKNKEIKIYPLALPEGANPMFQVLSPQKEFSSVTMKIEYPWGRTVQEVKPEIRPEFIYLPFDAKKMNRFIIHFTVKQNNEEKRTSIQVENG